MAWSVLGWEAAFFSEIEAFPSAVLAHHYPTVPNRGDMTRFQEWPDEPIDLLVGGTPCQSFSVAGLRAGLADPRGNLMLTYLAIVAKRRPKWVVWENVPGVLSSNSGRDFGTFLRGLGELGYGFAYRVLDAQFCRASGFPNAVPQRRRRVFVVGHSGDWRRAAAVLFDAASLRGDSAPSREARQEVAPTVSTGTRGVGDFELGGGLVGGIDYESNPHGPGDATGPILKGSPSGGGHPLPAVAFGWPAEVSPTLDTFYGDKMGLEDQHVFNQRGGKFVPVPFDTTQITSKANYSQPKAGDPMHPLAAGAHPPAIAFGWQNSASQGDSASSEITPTLDKSKTPAVAFTASEQANSFAWERDVYPTLDAQIPNDTSNIQKGVRQGFAVRRLTPRECERLQGFPDDYTAVPYRKKPAADGPRYKALGNSMAVNVMRVIGSRIQMVDVA
jgi:DNA (cytosine-5)-methyltransferase 1